MSGTSGIVIQRWETQASPSYSASSGFVEVDDASETVFARVKQVRNYLVKVNQFLGRKK